MADYLGPEELLEHHKKALGPELGSLYNSLFNELSRLFTKWEQFETLFAAKPTRIDIMNQTAPLFFRIVEDLLWQDILLHIARMVDKTKTAGKENLSIRWFSEFVQDPSKKAEITRKIDEAVSLASFAVDWRNRRIAHRDRSLSTSSSVTPLEEANTLKVKAVFKSLESVLNWVASEYLDSTVLYDLDGNPGGALNLLSYLARGIEERNNRLKRMEDGTATDSDYSPRAV
jgi:hypothetical protein